MTANSTFIALRRQLAQAGGHPAASPAEAAQSRRDEATYRPAELIEPPLRHIVVGDAEAWDEDVAFVDGTQHVELIGYAGTLPVIAAVVRAAVRLRRHRRFEVAVEVSRRLIVARAEAFSALGSMASDHELVRVDSPDEPHPIRDLELARAAVDRVRGAAEIDVVRQFRRRQGETWLVVDGSLAVSPDLSNDPRAVGVVKSHAMLPFQGEELELYLTLPRGCRTSIFKPQSRRVTPLYAWALRLHDFAGRDLFHGLVRVEAAAIDDTVRSADLLSRRLLAERAPLARDPRADRLLYGIHDVERYLGARGA